MTPASRRSPFAALVLLGAAALTATALAACTGGPATPSSSPATDASASAPATTPSTAPEVTPTVDPPEAGCSTVLTEAANAQLLADGLEQVDVGMSTYYPIADELIAAGGIACKWGRPSSDASITVVQLTGIDVASSEWPASLQAAGYTQTDDPVAGTYSGPADPGTGVPSVVVVAPDRLTFVSAPPHAADLAPAQ